MGVNYHMLLFTDFVPSNEIKIAIGWSVLTMTSIMVIGNLIPMFI